MKELPNLFYTNHQMLTCKIKNPVPVTRCSAKNGMPLHSVSLTTKTCNEVFFSGDLPCNSGITLFHNLFLSLSSTLMIERQSLKQWIVTPYLHGSSPIRLHCIQSPRKLQVLTQINNYHITTLTVIINVDI